MATSTLRNGLTTLLSASLFSFFPQAAASISMIMGCMGCTSFHPAAAVGQHRTVNYPTRRHRQRGLQLALCERVSARLIVGEIFPWLSSVGTYLWCPLDVPLVSFGRTLCVLWTYLCVIWTCLWTYHEDIPLWNLCILYLLAFQVRVTGGDSRLCCVRPSVCNTEGRPPSRCVPVPWVWDTCPSRTLYQSHRILVVLLC